MTLQRRLPAPWQLIDFPYTIRITMRWDDEVREIQQACGPVDVPEDVEEALIVLVPEDSRIQPCGPPLCWDQESDGGRGMWVQFDPSLHGIPSKVTPVDVVPESEEAPFEPEDLETESEDSPIEPNDFTPESLDALVEEEDWGLASDEACVDLDDEVNSD